jgi:hypothetical protein
LQHGFNGVTEGAVTQVVEQRRQSQAVSVLLLDDRELAAAVARLAVPSLRMPLKGVRHEVDGTDDTEDVFEAVMHRTREHQMGKAELPDAPHALQHGGVEKGDLPREELDGPPDRVVDLLGPEVDLSKALLKRAEPLLTELVDGLGQVGSRLAKARP